MDTFYDAPDVIVKLQKMSNDGLSVQSETDISSYIDDDSLKLSAKILESEFVFGEYFATRFEFTTNRKINISNKDRIAVYVSDTLIFIGYIDNKESKCDILELTNYYSCYDIYSKLLTSVKLDEFIDYIRYTLNKRTYWDKYGKYEFVYAYGADFIDFCRTKGIILNLKYLPSRVSNLQDIRPSIDRLYITPNYGVNYTLLDYIKMFAQQENYMIGFFGDMLIYYNVFLADVKTIDISEIELLNSSTNFYPFTSLVKLLSQDGMLLGTSQYNGEFSYLQLYTYYLDSDILSNAPQSQESPFNLVRSLIDNKIRVFFSDMIRYESGVGGVDTMNLKCLLPTVAGFDVTDYYKWFMCKLKLQGANTERMSVMTEFYFSGAKLVNKEISCNIRGFFCNVDVYTFDDFSFSDASLPDIFRYIDLYSRFGYYWGDFKIKSGDIKSIELSGAESGFGLPVQPRQTVNLRVACVAYSKYSPNYYFENRKYHLLLQMGPLEIPIKGNAGYVYYVDRNTGNIRNCPSEKTSTMYTLENYCCIQKWLNECFYPELPLALKDNILNLKEEVYRVGGGGASSSAARMEWWSGKVGLLNKLSGNSSSLPLGVEHTEAIINDFGVSGKLYINGTRVDVEISGTGVSGGASSTLSNIEWYTGKECTMRTTCQQYDYTMLNPLYFYYPYYTNDGNTSNYGVGYADLSKEDYKYFCPLVMV